MITIGNLILKNIEIIKENSNLGFSRTKATNSNDEYSLGKNKNLFTINIRNKFPLYKVSLNLLLDRNKYISLEEIYTQQQSERMYNYKIGEDITGKILYSYKNPTSKTNFCFLENFELIDSVINNGVINYKCKLDIIEI